MYFFDRYAKVMDDHKVDDLCDSQPTKGNIEGGRRIRYTVFSASILRRFLLSSRFHR